MSKYISALFRDDSKNSFFNSPIIYFAVGILLFILVCIELTQGVVYPKHTGSIPLQSFGSYFILGFHIMFCLIAVAVGLNKLRKNIQY